MANGLDTSTHRPGRSATLITRSAIAGTAIFVIVAVLAAAIEGWALSVFTVVTLALFVLGSLAMLAAFFWGVDRSRTEEVSVAGLFLLMGSTERSMQRLLMGLVLVQVVVGVAVAAIRPFTALAFGILVPMYGLGMTGVWGARHGQFQPREKLDHKRPRHARPTQGEKDG